MNENKPHQDSLVIGIVGRAGSGKGSCARMILDVASEHGVHGNRLTFSDLLAETLNEYGVETTRDNLQQIAIFMHERRSDALVHRMRQAILSNPQTLIVVDGIRRWPDYEMFRSFPNNFVIYLQTSEQVRFERLKARSQKPEEAAMTFKQFEASEKVSTEVDIDEIGSKADIKIENDSSLEGLREKISSLWEDQLRDRLT